MPCLDPVAGRRRHYERHRAEVLARTGEYQRTHRDALNAKSRERDALRRDFIDSFRTPCVVCGEDRIATLDFHHLDPRVKECDAGPLARHAEAFIATELAKCVSLCANCHRRFHAGNAEVAARISTHQQEVA